MQILLVLVGLLWLVPTFGLLITSLLSPRDFIEEGWWQVFTDPGKLTWSNYDAVLHNDVIMSALWTTVLIAVGGTILPIIIAAFAGYAFAWLEFPGRDWLFILVIALLVVPIQIVHPDVLPLHGPRDLRHGAEPGPLPHGVRAAVRDLPAAQLLHRDPEGPRWRRRGSTAPRRCGSSCA